MTEGRVPSFFVVGAQKAGTTTLHEWLAGQRGVRLPRIKETHFFSDDRRWSEGRQWYEDWFRGASPDQILGEVDPDYLFYPLAPERMRATVAAPRLVYVFRHPLERAFSHYRMSVRRGLETLTFDRALSAEVGRLAGGDPVALQHRSYMARGRYTEQLSRYRVTFPGARELLLKFEELCDPDSAIETYERLCRFVGAEPGEGPDLGRAANPASENRFDGLSRMLHRPSRLRRAVGRLIPSRNLRLRAGVWLDRINRRPAPPIDPAWRDLVPGKIVEASRRETERLAASTGLDLSDWLERWG